MRMNRERRFCVMYRQQSAWIHRTSILTGRGKSKGNREAIIELRKSQPRLTPGEEIVSFHRQYLECSAMAGRATYALLFLIKHTHALHLYPGTPRRILMQ